MCGVEERPALAALSKELLSASSSGRCFVLCAGRSLSEALLLDAACRRAGVPFVWCHARRGRAVVFADFGEQHEVYDLDGAEPAAGTLLATSVARDSAALVWEAEEERHGLYRDDVLLPEDGGPPRKVLQVLSARMLVLSAQEGDKDGDVLRFRQAKQGRTVSHAPMSSFVTELRAAFPEEEDAEEQKEEDEERNKRTGAVDEHQQERQRRRLAPPQQAALETLAAAVAAHELLKRGGKFTPLEQLWCHAEPSDALLTRPTTKDDPLRLLIVGAGAIGCELLKVLALSGEYAHVTVVDPDHIEQTNLARQLLFRDSDIGASKAKVAARETTAMSQGRVVVEPIESLLSSASEAALGDEMYTNADAVLGAVDNLEARKYVDGRCKTLGVMLIDCGTQGSQGSVQVVIPHVTESYSASADPPMPQIPQCTLHMFPTRSLHTVLSAADAFAGLFSQPPAVDDKKSAIVSHIAWAEAVFQERFVSGIEALLARHPIDSVVPESGLLFWAAPRRVPRPLVFAPSSSPRHARFVELSARLREASLNALTPFDKDGHPEHVEWIALFANLRADCYGIEHVSELEARRIAGRIVPALVTTTAAVSALALLQLWRARSGPLLRPRFANYFANLALSGAIYDSEPIAPRMRKLRADWSVSEWTMLDTHGPCTWRDLVEQLETQHRMQLLGLSLSSQLLWSQFAAAVDEDEDVLSWLQQRGLAGRRRCIVFSATADLDPDGNESEVDPNAELPEVRFHFLKK